MAIITKSIGSAVGRDYATPQAWFAAIPTDVVASGNSYVGELYNDSPFTGDYGPIFSGKTTGPSNTIWLKCAAGHSFRDSVNIETRALRYNTANGVSFAYNYNNAEVNQSYMTLSGVQGRSAQGGIGIRSSTTVGTLVENCLSETWDVRYGSPLQLSSGTVRNCLGINAADYTNNGNDGPGVNMYMVAPGALLENCTVVRTGAAGGTALYNVYNNGVSTVKNCALFGFTSTSVNPNSLTGINNVSDIVLDFATNTNSLSNLLAVDQFVNPVTDLRTKTGSALINAGATPTDATAQALNGTRVRSGVVDIGAWEFNPPPASAVTISGAAAITQGYSLIIRVSTDYPLKSGESAVVTLSDGAGGTFTPSVSLSDTVAYKDVTYTSSGALGTRTITASSVGTPTLTNGTKAITVQAPIDASQLIVTSSANTGAVGISMSITVTTDQVLRSGQVANLAFSDGAGGMFDASPSLVLNTSNPSTTVNYVPAGSGGARTVTVTSTGTPTLAAGTKALTIADAPPVFISGQQNIYNVGANRQFATIKAACTFLADKDLVSLNASAIIYVHEDTALPDMYFYVISDETHFVSIEPAPGRSHLDLDNTGPLDYGTQGVEIVGTGQFFHLSWGISIKKFRMNFDSNSSIEYGVGGMTGSSLAGTVFSKNKVKINGNGYGKLASGNYQCHAGFFFNLFIRESGTGAQIDIGDSTREHYGNTFVARGTATGNCGLTTGAYTQLRLHDNVFVDCGPVPIITPSNITPIGYANNYTNVAVDPTKTNILPGLVVNTTLPFVENVASDLRPALGGFLIGKGGPSLVSVNDIRGNNYGTSPDVGASQRVPATPLTAAVVTELLVKGQTVTLRGTTQNSVTSGLASLLANAVPNGAVPRGPTSVTLTSGAFEVVFTGVMPGTYDAPVLSFTNAGGSALATGAYPFIVLSITGNPEAVIDAASGIITGQSGIQINFAATGPVTITPLPKTLTVIGSAASQTNVGSTSLVGLIKNSTVTCPYPFDNKFGTLRVNEGVTIVGLNATTRVVDFVKTGLTTDANGMVAPFVVPSPVGTRYELIGEFATDAFGNVRSIEPITTT